MKELGWCWRPQDGVLRRSYDAPHPSASARPCDPPRRAPGCGGGWERGGRGRGSRAPSPARSGGSCCLGAGGARRVLRRSPGGSSTGRHRAEWERLLADEKSDVVVLKETHLYDAEFPRAYWDREACPPRPVKAVYRLSLNGQNRIAAREDGGDWIKS